MSLAASGAPNRMLTLTCAATAVPDADDARAALHAVWRALRSLIAREFAYPSSYRWPISAKAVARRRRLRRARAAPLAGALSPVPLPYFAVVERHKNGRPHLHILLRCGYIPQRWLSAQMSARLSSPICDIRKVASRARAAAYAAKYIGKAPARFGTARAYWYTRNYSTDPSPAAPIEAPQRQWFGCARAFWSETLEKIAITRPTIDVTSDGWYSFAPEPRRGITLWYQNRCPPVFLRSAGRADARVDDRGT